MVDAHALGACGFGRAGSNPASPTSSHVFGLWIDESPRSFAHDRHDVPNACCSEGVADTWGGQCERVR